MSLRVAVLVRRIPDPSRLQMDRRTGTLLTEGVPFVLNPADRSALELALRIQDEAGARVVAVTADDATAEAELREAVAMGADEAVLLADARFRDADPLLHARALRLALAKWVRPDIVFAASRSVDHSWSTVGPQVAQLLGWPLIIEAENVSTNGKTLSADAHTGATRAKVETDVPCLVTVARGVVRARHPTSWAVARSFGKRRISLRSLDELGSEQDEVQSLNPPTRTTAASLVRRKRAGKRLEGSPEDVGRVTAGRLIDLGFAGRRS